MNQTKSSYKNLIENFTEEKLKKRFSLIYAAAKDFIKCRGLEDYVFIDTVAIKEFMVDYFSDILRLKEFHNIERTNPTKVAAYTAYWIQKRKPLNIIKRIPPEIYQKKPYAKHLNEYFASNLLIGMNYNTKEYLHHDKWDKWNLFHNNLLYFLIYRVATAQSLELALLALDATPIHPKIL